MPHAIYLIVESTAQKQIFKIIIQDKMKPSIVRVYPPAHSVLFVSLIMAAFSASLPPMLRSLDSAVSLETLSIPIFSSHIDSVTLGWIRLLISLYMFRVTVARIMSKRPPLEVNYLKETKLKSSPIDVSGIRSLYMFTCLSWVLLSISFFLNGAIVLLIHYRFIHSVHPSVLKLAIIIFEIAAPLSMLVSAVVRYVLWPQALRGKGTQLLKSWETLLQHNANIILSLVEIGLLGGLPIRLEDWIAAPLFGLCYILFSWFMIHRLVPSGEPQVLYFFLDPTLGMKSTFALLCLLVVLLIFYIIFSLIDDLMLHLGGGIVIHSLVIVGISSLVCRFKD